MPEDADLTQLAPNTMIEGPMWDGPATFVGMEPDGGLLTILVDGQRRTIPVPSAGHGIHVAETARGEPWKAYVAVERLRHECARNLGTLLGAADQLPHQLKTIYQVSGEPGRIRYMIADEPGGGKTVVASRIIQELTIQKQARRVLIVVPALLRYQWQGELKKFVNMESRIIGGDARGLANPWLDDRILITSMDYAKQEHHMRMLEQANFDLVVVDEAHNLNATVKKSTDRYKLGELLGRISNHMLFLTATPHRGKPDNFRLLLKLLEPDLFSNPKMSPGAVYDAKSRLFIRHAKDDMVDMDGNELFLGRSVKSATYRMSATERLLYDAVTEYVGRQYSLQMGRDANRISTFAVLVIQKRMASSTRALRESLRRRRQRLEGRLTKWDGPMDDRDVDGDMDDMDEGEMGKLEHEASGYTSAQTAGELKAELDELDGLIGMADKTSKTKPDTKLERLISGIRDIGNDKLLIFSEYVDTLDYLEEKISEMRRADGSTYDISRIDGSMSMDARVDAQEAFRMRSQIMLATDAAREGINLQFCHRMINYDLPWTPISLEQRMGRLHRYGQKHDVVISNMVAIDTREGQVMETLFEKIRQIETQYPTFNVMGQVMAGGDLEGLLADAIMGGSAQEMADRVDEAARRARNVDEMLGHTPIDVRDVRRRMDQIGAQRTDGEYLVKMAERLFDGLGGSVRHAGKKTKLDVPEAIRYGPLPKRRHAYDMPPGRLLARGGDIYNHLNGWIRKHCSGDLKFGSVFRDPGGFDGYVVFHTITVRDKAWRQVGRLLAAHKYADGVAGAADPYVLHGMKYDNAVEAGPAPPMEHVRKAVLEMARAEADTMVDERKKFWDHRTRAATGRMARESEELRRQVGNTGFGAERNKMEERLRELERRQEEVDAEHSTAVTLMPEAPVLEGWVRVVPDDGAPDAEQDTEKIGMDASMAHERAEGFEVTDVHKQHGIGYDVLSIHPDGRRREIEVKARCDMSCAQFTEAEREHLLRSEHAVIHIIGNAGRPDQTFITIHDTKGVRLKHDTVYTMPVSEIRRLAG